jgi:hypothetical protein
MPGLITSLSETQVRYQNSGEKVLKNAGLLYKELFYSILVF